MRPSGLQWYAVYTQARLEYWARSNLWDRGLEVYLPIYRKERRHARKTDWINAPLFPRYLFVAADLQSFKSNSINSIPGVISLVAFGERPGVIPDTVIQKIKARENIEGHVQLVDQNSLKPGEEVRIQSGAMAEHIGLFETKSAGERVVVLLNLLGREVRVTTPSSAIARVL